VNGDQVVAGKLQALRLAWHHNQANRLRRHCFQLMHLLFLKQTEPQAVRQILHGWAALCQEGE